MNQYFEKIYNNAFDLVEVMLNKQEEPIPFSVTLKEDQGSVQMYENGGMVTKEQIENIKESLSASVKNNSIDCFCLCYVVNTTDPRTNNKTEAVLFELSGSDNQQIIYLPYNFEDDMIIKKPFQPSEQ